MRIAFSPRPLKRPPGKLKLWHLAVAVLLWSLVLGGCKALSRGSRLSMSETMVALVGVWVVASFTLFIVFKGAKLANRITRRMRDRGIARGGAYGVVVCGLDLAANLVFVMASIHIVLTVIFLCFWVLLHLEK